jgi:hypothetical protein
MSGPLCDAVLDSSSSAAALESLERSNLFMVPLDRTGEWYRYHHLFQELLRAELGRVEPDLLPRLLARAADWCEANGQPETAIGYTQAADDVNRTARLIVRSYLDTYNSGRAATVERWLSWLDAHGAIETNAAVAVIGGLTAALWGRPAEAERCAEAAERASYEGTLYDGSASIDSWQALMRAQHCRQGVTRMRGDAELAVATLARGSRLRPSAMVLLAISHWLAGDIDQADDLFADVAEAPHAARSRRLDRRRRGVCPAGLRGPEGIRPSKLASSATRGARDRAAPDESIDRPGAERPFTIAMARGLTSRRGRVNAGAAGSGDCCAQLSGGRRSTTRFAANSICAACGSLGCGTGPAVDLVCLEGAWPCRARRVSA